MHFDYTIHDIIGFGLAVLFFGGLALLAFLLSLFVDFVASLWEKRWWK